MDALLGFVKDDGRDSLNLCGIIKSFEDLGMNRKYFRRAGKSLVCLGMAVASCVAWAAPGDLNGVVERSSSVDVFRLGSTHVGTRLTSSGQSRSSHYAVDGNQRASASIASRFNFLRASGTLFEVSSNVSGNYTGRNGVYGADSSWRLDSRIRLMGVTVIDRSATDVGVADTGSRSYSRNFVESDGRYSVGVFEVRAYGRVTGIVRSRSYSLGRNTDNSGIEHKYGYSWVNLGGAVHGHGTGAVCLVSCSLGPRITVTTEVKILDTNLTNTSTFNRREYASRGAENRYNYSGDINSDGSYSIGSGSFRIRAEFGTGSAPFGGSYSNTLASWGDIVAGTRNYFNSSYAEDFAHGVIVSPPSTVVANIVNNRIPEHCTRGNSGGTASGPNSNLRWQILRCEGFGELTYMIEETWGTHRSCRVYTSTSGFNITGRCDDFTIRADEVRVTL